MVLSDGKQIMYGSFDDLMRQGFNFDDIVKEFGTVTYRNSSYMEELKANQNKKLKSQMSLLKKSTSKVSERDYVAAITNNSKDKPLSDDESEEAMQIRKHMR